eukprot:g45310.t1
MPTSIDHVVTIAAPTDTMDHVTSGDASHATSGTTSHATVTAIHNVDTAASITKTGSAACIKDAAADNDTALPTTDATPPTADTLRALRPTATSSTANANANPKPSRVYTIPPDLPLTEDE